MKKKSKKFSLLVISVMILMWMVACDSHVGVGQSGNHVADENTESYLLPPPILDGDISVEQTLANRRSHRNFTEQALTMEQLSQILWAAYGVTNERGFRTAPSAGALFPLELFVVVGNVMGIEAGVYRYVASEHKLVKTLDQDIREELSEAALGQRMVREAPVVIVYTAVMRRTTGRYGEQQGRRYVYMEVGHSAQNVYLQVEALGLGTCAVGAFGRDTSVTMLGLDSAAEEEMLYLMPVGYIAR